MLNVLTQKKTLSLRLLLKQPLQSAASLTAVNDRGGCESQEGWKIRHSVPQSIKNVKPEAKRVGIHGRL